MAGTTLLMNEDTVSTVNVIVYNNRCKCSSITEFKSWLDVPEGNKAAEEYFAKKIRERAPQVTDEEMAELIMDGYANSAGYEYFITHST